ncbi:MAG: cell division protein ZapB [Acidobacteriota bacterium]
MATTTSKTTATELEPIDRLEEKIKLLVSVIGRLKGEQARASEENARLSRDVEALRARISEAEPLTAEVAQLRKERDDIRNRVTEMLHQLDTLNL